MKGRKQQRSIPEEPVLRKGISIGACSALRWAFRFICLGTTAFFVGASLGPSWVVRVTEEKVHKPSNQKPPGKRSKTTLRGKQQQQQQPTTAAPNTLPQELPLTAPPAAVSDELDATTKEAPTCEERCRDFIGAPVDVNGAKFRLAVRDYLVDPASSPYGSQIGCWNVSAVTDMTAAFDALLYGLKPVRVRRANATRLELLRDKLQTFNEPLDCWDVSNVESMNYMFRNATHFNQPLQEWNVSKVGSMTAMFANATSFDQPLQEWNVSGVEIMSSMFQGAASFNQPLSNWNVTQVIAMEHMFAHATSFNQPLDAWTVRNMETMAGMFQNATSFDQSLCAWQTDQPLVQDPDMFQNTACDQEQPWCQPCVTVATADAKT